MKIDHAYVKMEFKNKNRWKTTIILREGFMRKNSRSFGFCNYFSLVFPPSFRQFGKLVQLFSNVKIQDLKVRLGLKILLIHYNMLYIYNLQTKVEFVHAVSAGGSVKFLPAE